MKTLIALLVMVGAAWAGDIPYENTEGIYVTKVEIGEAVKVPSNYELFQRIEDLERQVQELRVKTLPPSCLEYHSEIKGMADIGDPPDGAFISVYEDRFVFMKIKEACQ